MASAAISNDSRSVLPDPKLYIKHLPATATERDVVKCLKECLKLRVRIDRNTPEEFVQGTVEFDTLFNGKLAEKAYAIANGQRLPHSDHMLQLTISADQDDPRPRARTRLLSSLPEDATPGAIFTLCRKFGPVQRVALKMVQGNIIKFGQSASVTFYHETDARDAELDLHCSEFGGQTISVCIDRQSGYSTRAALHPGAAPSFRVPHARPPHLLGSQNRYATSRVQVGERASVLSEYALQTHQNAQDSSRAEESFNLSSRTDPVAQWTASTSVVTDREPVKPKHAMEAGWGTEDLANMMNSVKVENETSDLSVRDTSVAESWSPPNGESTLQAEVDTTLATGEEEASKSKAKTIAGWGSFSPATSMAENFAAPGWNKGESTSYEVAGQAAEPDQLFKTSNGAANGWIVQLSGDESPENETRARKGLTPSQPQDKMEPKRGGWGYSSQDEKDIGYTSPAKSGDAPTHTTVAEDNANENVRKLHSHGWSSIGTREIQVKAGDISPVAPDGVFSSYSPNSSPDAALNPAAPPFWAPTNTSPVQVSGSPETSPDIKQNEWSPSQKRGTPATTPSTSPDRPLQLKAINAKIRSIKELASLPAKQIMADELTLRRLGLDPVPEDNRKDTTDFMNGIRDLDAQECKQKLGERIYPKIKMLVAKGAPRITIWLLDYEDLDALAQLANMPDLFEAKVHDVARKV
ncbi:hypothetical protein OIV83_004368 [Microbotryomycetes sp. JL201]|nr:hypothetical protein OIV83_004368 [Microbotryomycetes sp. JL201]